MVAQAQHVLDFNFNILLDPSGGPFGPYQTATVSFLAQPAQGSLLVGPLQGNCPGSLSASLPIFNMTVTESGMTVLQGGTGSFGFMDGSPVNLTCNVYFSEPLAFRNSTGTVSIFGFFDQNFRNSPAGLSSHDPLGAILDGSAFGSSGFASCTLPGLGTISGAQGECEASGVGTSVLEPDSAVLFGLGMIVLAIVRRRRGTAHTSGVVGGLDSRPESGTGAP